MRKLLDYWIPKPRVRAIAGVPIVPVEPSKSKTSESPCDAKPQPFAA
jgi:hypothetical protein